MVCRPSQRQQENWLLNVLNEVHQEDETSLGMPEEHNQSFDAERVKYINFNSAKSILFAKLESRASQRQTKVTYEIDSGADGNIMPFKYSNVCFQRQWYNLYVQQNNLVIQKQITI